MLKVFKRLFKDEAGQGLAEYALILAGIAIVVMVVVWALGEQIREVFIDISSKLGERPGEE